MEVGGGAKVRGGRGRVGKVQVPQEGKAAGAGGPAAGGAGVQQGKGGGAQEAQGGRGIKGREEAGVGMEQKETLHSKLFGVGRMGSCGSGVSESPRRRRTSP